MMTAVEQSTEITTLRPIKDDTPAVERAGDEASEHGFHIGRLEAMVSDCDNQPLWRDRADIAHAYVDGKQLTELQQAALIAEGMADVKPTNLVGRVIRSTLGQEAKSRTDVRVEADEDDYNDLCDVFNPRLMEAKRETYADQAVSNAYASQVIGGLGWVEVARNMDPLSYAYRVTDVHRSEMWWDWRAQDVLLRDARWVVRKRWQDLDELEAAMPQFRDVLRNMANNWAGFVWDDTLDESTRSLSPYYTMEGRWNRVQRRMDWFDSARKRVKMYEVWYKVKAMGVVLRFSPTRTALFDPENQAHIAAVNAGTAQISKQLTTQVRMALYAGPHRLLDVGTKKRNFPYVPFMAYRDDEDNSPYGLVEGMIAPQDEYNARRLRINWLLRARQVVMDSDALDTKANSLKDVVAQINRPDLTVILNPNRANKNSDAFRVESNLALQKEQIDVMQDAKQNIQDVPGVYGSQLGQQASGVTSGIANSLLIEQGAIAMGDLNDNYRHSRRMVYENLLDLIVEDHSMPDLVVKIGRGSAKREVILNHWDPEQNTIVNDTKDAPLRVGLGEVPSTPAYRLQQQQQLAAIIQAVSTSAPQAAAVLIPSFLEATDLPDRMERADDVRRALGVPTAGDRAQAEAQKEQQAAQAEKDAALKDQLMQIGLAKEAATAENEGAKARLTAAQVEETESKTQLNLANVVKVGADMALAANQPTQKPEAAPAAPEQESPDDADARMIDEAIAEARARRGQAIAA